MLGKAVPGEASRCRPYETTSGSCGVRVLGAADCRILQKPGSREATFPATLGTGEAMALCEPGAGGSACIAIIGDAPNLRAGQWPLFDHQLAIFLLTPALFSQSMVWGFCPSSWLSPSSLSKDSRMALNLDYWAGTWVLSSAFSSSFLGAPNYYPSIFPYWMESYQTLEN